MLTPGPIAEAAACCPVIGLTWSRATGGREPGSSGPRPGPAAAWPLRCPRGAQPGGCRARASASARRAGLSVRGASHASGSCGASDPAELSYGCFQSSPFPARLPPRRAREAAEDAPRAPAPSLSLKPVKTGVLKKRNSAQGSPLAVARPRRRSRVPASRHPLLPAPGIPPFLTHAARKGSSESGNGEAPRPRGAPGGTSAPSARPPALQQRAPAERARGPAGPWSPGGRAQARDPGRATRVPPAGPAAGQTRSRSSRPARAQLCLREPGQRSDLRLCSDVLDANTNGLLFPS